MEGDIYPKYRLFISILHHRCNSSLPPPKHSAFQFIPMFTPHLTIQTTCPFGQLCPTFQHAASLFLASAPPFLRLPIPDYYRPLSRNKLQQCGPRRLLDVTIRETFSFSFPFPLPCFFNQVAIPCSHTPSPFLSLSFERERFRLLKIKR